MLDMIDRSIEDELIHVLNDGEGGNFRGDSGSESGKSFGVVSDCEELIIDL